MAPRRHRFSPLDWLVSMLLIVLVAGVVTRPERLEAARDRQAAAAAGPGPLVLLGRAPWVGATLGHSYAAEALAAARSGKQGR
ncbi:MAG: hypothetical protein ISQ08_07340 [Planctomycetes bacterium]|nr:hypothetical protein [Planctomycetota bacterium]